LGIVAVGLAFLVVQAASLMQKSPAAVGVKTEMLAEPSVRSQETQTSIVSGPQAILTVVLGPLAIAALCYFLVRKTI
jgi:hypothetical protein